MCDSSEQVLHRRARELAGSGRVSISPMTALESPVHAASSGLAHTAQTAGRSFTAGKLARSTVSPVALIEWILVGFERSGVVVRNGDAWIATERGLALSYELNLFGPVVEEPA
jgi:hypothetical protein